MKSIQSSTWQAFLANVTKLDPLQEDFAVQCVNLLIGFAIPAGASDVHLNPKPDGWEIRLRMDGVLVDLVTIAKGGAGDPVTRLMVMAGLPSYRAGQPMEGRLKRSDDLMDQLGPEASNASLRLGVFPTVHGPRAVVRILRHRETLSAMEDLGLCDQVTQKLIGLCDQTSGAVLLSGPAGSGKTTTLYAMLRRIAEQDPRRSVLTIEDPVESVLPSINQSEIDVASGMTLASSLRSAVRQDSEVLLVSEIRDPETTEVAVQASLTGHLVFSSLHATDVPTTLRRLVTYGIPPHALESGLRAIVNQRLLRKRCIACQPSHASRECENCLGTGHDGRVAIAQCVLFDGSDPIGNSFFQTLANGSPRDVMIANAIDVGWKPLRTDASVLCDRGITDEAEVFRIFGSPSVG